MGGGGPIIMLSLSHRRKLHTQLKDDCQHYFTVGLTSTARHEKGQSDRHNPFKYL